MWLQFQTTVSPFTDFYPLKSKRILVLFLPLVDFENDCFSYWKQWTIRPGTVINRWKELTEAIIGPLGFLKFCQQDLCYSYMTSQSFQICFLFICSCNFNWSAWVTTFFTLIGECFLCAFARLSFWSRVTLLTLKNDSLCFSLSLSLSLSEIDFSFPYFKEMRQVSACHSNWRLFERSYWKQQYIK